MGTEKEFILTPEQVEAIYDEAKSEYTEYDIFFGALRRGYAKGAIKYLNEVEHLKAENNELRDRMARAKADMEQARNTLNELKPMLATAMEQLEDMKQSVGDLKASLLRQ